jgi:hypothetical protein
MVIFFPPDVRPTDIALLLYQTLHIVYAASGRFHLADKFAAVRSRYTQIEPPLIYAIDRVGRHLIDDVVYFMSFSILKSRKIMNWISAAVRVSYWRYRF